jgi:hypothetical protein
MSSALLRNPVPTAPVPLPSLRTLFPRCANPDCSTVRSPWHRLRRPGRGIVAERNWFCQPECLRRTLQELLDTLCGERMPASPPARRIPIGLILLQQGLITAEQLQRALELQRTHGRERLGYWLRQMGAIGEAELTRALAIQWACPVFPLERDTGYRQCAHLVPRRLAEASGMIPVYLSRDGSLLYTGFTSGIDYALLYAIEQMLPCRTIPCLVSETAYARAMAVLERMVPPRETVFDSVRRTEEMTAIAVNFAERFAARSLRVQRVGAFLWLRLVAGREFRDLLFQTGPHVSAGPPLASPR